MKKTGFTDYEELVRKKDEAEVNRDALTYFNVCNELGLTGEAIDRPFLYERAITDMKAQAMGKLEKKIRKTPRKPSKRTVPNEIYAGFYNFGLNLSSDICADTEKKKEILVKFFPRRFGKCGKQCVGKYEEPQIGKIFNSVMDYAEERINQ